MHDSFETTSIAHGHSFELCEWSWKPYGAGPPVVIFEPGLKERGLTQQRLLTFRAFDDWWRQLERSMTAQVEATHEFHENPYVLRCIRVQAFDSFQLEDKEHIKFMKIFAEIENDRADWLPGVVFLRGSTVAVLMIIQPSDAPSEQHVIMTEQACVAAGSLSFLELPSGMVEDDTDMTSAVTRLFQEQIGITPIVNELINMTQMADSLQNDDLLISGGLTGAIYPSPNTCDERISMFLWKKEMDRLELEMLRDRLTTNRAEFDLVPIRFVEYDKLISIANRDGKTLAAWALYEYLKRVEKLH